MRRFPCPFAGHVLEMAFSYKKGEDFRKFRIKTLKDPVDEHEGCFIWIFVYYVSVFDIPLCDT